MDDHDLAKALAAQLLAKLDAGLCQEVPNRNTGVDVVPLLVKIECGDILVGKGRQRRFLKGRFLPRKSDGQRGLGAAKGCCCQHRTAEGGPKAANGGG